MPSDELIQIIHQIRQAEAPAHGEAIVFSSELISDDPILLGETSGQQTHQLHPSCQTRNKHDRLTCPPFAIIDSVVSQLGTSPATQPWAKFGTGGLQPFQGRLHCGSPCSESELV